MSLPVPEDTGFSVKVPSLVFVRPVFFHVIEQVLATDRGDFVRDDDEGEILLHLELNDEDLEFCPILHRENAAEIWMVLDNPTLSEPRMIAEDDLRESICRHSRIEYLCEVCNPVTD